MLLLHVRQKVRFKTFTLRLSQLLGIQSWNQLPVRCICRPQPEFQHSWNVRWAALAPDAYPQRPRGQHFANVGLVQASRNKCELEVLIPKNK